MARGFIKLQEELHHRLLKLRSIEASIRRPQFERLWDDSTPMQRAKLQLYIFNADKQQVAAWMDTHPSLDLGEKKLIELKRLALKLGIENVSRMGKLELVRAIKGREYEKDIHA